MTVSKALVLITGANQGIGFATAPQLASSDKFHVLVGARVASKAEAAVQQLRSDTVVKSALTPITINVTDDASIAAAAQIVAGQFGLLDILNYLLMPSGHLYLSQESIKASTEV